MPVRWSPLALAVAIALSGCKGGEDTEDTDAEDTDDGGDTDVAGTPLDCEVVVVGGGVGGLHTAFRLAPTLGDGVCLFEKEAQLGGRIKDVARDESDPESPRVGVGARRVMEGQTILFSLAEELGITLETPAPAGDLVNARGSYAFAKEDLVGLYGLTPDASGDTETALYDELRFGPERDNIDDYPDFRSYGRAAIGAESWDFLHDMSRFRADFQAPLSARGYLDYFDEEWDVCCQPQYPVGGMSRFVVGMHDAAVAAGARVYTEEPVSAIRRADGGGYEIVTEEYVVSAQKVVIAVPPSGLDWIQGDVVDEIRAQPEYRDLYGVKVVSITQWWDSPWYQAVKTPDGSPVWRAWTTEHCLTFIEIPQEPYAAAANVTRSVYNDDIACTAFWEEVAARGNDAVEAEVKRGLEHLFANNGLTEPVSIPDPVKTHVQIWPAGWYWLRAGATVTNAEVYAWAVDPLGEDVSLVGEAYHPQRSGWSDAAYKSSIHLLNTKYGMDLPGL